MSLNKSSDVARGKLAPVKDTPESKGRRERSPNMSSRNDEDESPRPEKRRPRRREKLAANTDNLETYGAGLASAGLNLAILTGDGKGKPGTTKGKTGGDKKKKDGKKDGKKDEDEGEKPRVPMTPEEIAETIAKSTEQRNRERMDQIAILENQHLLKLIMPKSTFENLFDSIKNGFRMITGSSKNGKTVVEGTTTTTEETNTTITSETIKIQEPAEPIDCGKGDELEELKNQPHTGTQQHVPTGRGRGRPPKDSTKSTKQQSEDIGSTPRAPCKPKRQPKRRPERPRGDSTNPFPPSQNSREDGNENMHPYFRNGPPMNAEEEKMGLEYSSVFMLEPRDVHETERDDCPMSEAAVFRLLYRRVDEHNRTASANDRIALIHPRFVREVFGDGPDENLVDTERIHEGIRRNIVFRAEMTTRYLVPILRSGHFIVAHVGYNDSGMPTVTIMDSVFGRIGNFSRKEAIAIANSLLHNEHEQRSDVVVKRAGRSLIPMQDTDGCGVETVLNSETLIQHGHNLQNNKDRGTSNMHRSDLAKELCKMQIDDHEQGLIVMDEKEYEELKNRNQPGKQDKSSKSTTPKAAPSGKGRSSKKQNDEHLIFENDVGDKENEDEPKKPTSKDREKGENKDGGEKEDLKKDIETLKNRPQTGNQQQAPKRSRGRPEIISAATGDKEEDDQSRRLKQPEMKTQKSSVPKKREKFQKPADEPDDDKNSNDLRRRPKKSKKKKTAKMLDEKEEHEDTSLVVVDERRSRLSTARETSSGQSRSKKKSSKKQDVSVQVSSPTSRQDSRPSNDPEDGHFNASGQSVEVDAVKDLCVNIGKISFEDNFNPDADDLEKNTKH